MPVVEEILESSLQICEKHEQGELETMQFRSERHLGGQHR
jgi:hypothetical protein